MRGHVQQSMQQRVCPAMPLRGSRRPATSRNDLSDGAAVFRPGQCRHGQGEVIICRGVMPYRTSMNILSPSWTMLKQPFTS